MSVPHYNLERSSKEKYRSLLHVASADPTIDGLPQYKLVAEGTSPGTGSFVAGAWEGTWKRLNKEIWAISPSISGTGGGGTLTGSAGETYVLWVRWSVGSGAETPAQKAATITIT